AEPQMGCVQAQHVDEGEIRVRPQESQPSCCLRSSGAQKAKQGNVGSLGDGLARLGLTGGLEDHGRSSSSRSPERQQMKPWELALAPIGSALEAQELRRPLVWWRSECALWNSEAVTLEEELTLKTGWASRCSTLRELPVEGVL
ncbi:unnamed protein product, partial [Polarella glacialis]